MKETDRQTEEEKKRVIESEGEREKERERARERGGVVYSAIHFIHGLLHND